MIFGEVAPGDQFYLPQSTGAGRWFRRVDTILYKAGLQSPTVLPDAMCGLMTTSHQNCCVVQDLRTGQFYFLDCNVQVEQPSDEEIE